LDGQLVVTWTVTNPENEDATLIGVHADPATEVTTEVSGETTPLQGAVVAKNGGSVTATQVVPADTAKATLTIDAQWPSDPKRTNRGEVTLSGEPCAPTPPPCVELSQAKFTHTFDGPKGEATIRLEDGQTLCENGKEPVTLVSYFAPRPEFATPQYLHDSDTKVISNQRPEITLDVEVPVCHTQVDLFFGGDDDVIQTLTEDGPRYGSKLLGSPAAPGNRSEGPKGWFNGGTRACTQPQAQFVSNCDGTVQVNLSNDGAISRYAVEFVVEGAGGWTKTVIVEPGKADNSTVVPVKAAGDIKVKVADEVIEGGTYAWQPPEDCPLPTVAITPDCDSFEIAVTNPEGNTPLDVVVTYGDESEELTVTAGATDTVEFAAGDQNHATISFPGLDIAPLKAVYAQPADCGGGGGGPGLPVTGASVGGAAGVAVLLLGVGAGLFYLFRRRRLRFVA
jgi:hypothetical protein